MDSCDFDLPLSAAIAMVGFTRPWCIAGGWGIDLWLGKMTRQHSGVKIAILREHQIDLRDYCHGWKFHIKTMDGRLVAWKQTNRQMLMLPVRELQAHDRAARPIGISLHESDGIDWIDPMFFDVRRNLSTWLTRTSRGVPVLSPEVNLLIRSHDPGDRVELDFRSAADLLGEDQRTWLKLSLMRINAYHPWLDRL